MTRWKAATIHLGISATIGLAAAALMLGVWYPPPFFHAAGADDLVLLLVGVDLGLGPLLTLIVFNTRKRGLGFDLTIIAALQGIALIYGLAVVLEARPIFLVAAVDRLVLVSADEISDADLAQGSTPRFQTRSWTGPRLVAARMPTDSKERSDLAFSALAGRDLQNLPKYYCDYAAGGRSLLQRAQPLAKLLQAKPEAVGAIERWLIGTGRTTNALVWVPLQARKADLVMVLDAQTAQPLHAVAMDPW